MSSEDFYKLLDVTKNATEEEIKKGYKKAALKWHPDRNQHQKDLATEKFKQLNEAYHVLSDPEKRKIYDMYGVAGLKEGVGMRNYDSTRKFSGMENMFGQNMFNTNDFDDIFNVGGMENIFKGFKFSSGPNLAEMQNKNRRNGQRSGINFMDPNETFKMFFNNNHDMFANDDMNFFKKEQRNLDKKEEYKYNVKIDLEMLYNGGTKKLKISRFQKEKVFEIEIKAGWRSGTKVIFNDEIIGTITFIIEEKEHPQFKRDVNDLIHECKSENSILIESFSKKVFNIDVRNKKKGEQIIISDEGMPIRKDGKQIGFGDLIIRIKF